MTWEERKEVYKKIYDSDGEEKKEYIEILMKDDEEKSGSDREWEERENGYIKEIDRIGRDLEDLKKAYRDRFFRKSEDETEEIEEKKEEKYEYEDLFEEE